MPRRDSRTNESEKRSTATEHAKRGTATEHAKRTNASSSASKGGGKGDRRVKAKVEAHDDDSEDDYYSHGYGDRVVKPSTKESQKRGTATEHAEQRQSGALTYNAQTQQHMEEAQADRADKTMEQLAFNLAEFLTYLLRELCCSPRLEAECEDMVFEKITEWACAQEGTRFYGESELLQHKKMWDIMTRDKDGMPKEHSFCEWCRRIAMHSTRNTAACSAATEHAERDGPFRKLAEDILTSELTPEQMDDPVYQLCGDKSISTKQRGLINVLLRKNLGDPRVAYYIFEHGVPTLLDPPVQRESRRLEHDAQRALLQNMLQEFMTWHASLLQWLLERQKHPNTTFARRLSDLDQKEWQIERRRQKEEARQGLLHGTHLATLRDSGQKKLRTCPLQSNGSSKILTARNYNDSTKI